MKKLNSLLIIFSLVWTSAPALAYDPYGYYGTATHAPSAPPRPALDPRRSITQQGSNEISAENIELFCNRGGAEEIMLSLEAKNKDRVTELEKIAASIRDQKATTILLDNLRKVRDQYMESLNNLGGKAEQQAQAQIQEKQLTEIKSLLRNGLFLHMLSQSLESKDFQDPTKAPTVDTLCSGNSAISTTDTCTAGSWWLLNPKRLISSAGQERAQINQMLKTFHEAYHRISSPPSQEELDREVVAIIHSIPNEISPEIILPSLTSPNSALGKLLLTNSSKEDILKCVTSDKASDCGNVVSGDDYQKISEAISNDVQNFQTNIQSKFVQLYDRVNTESHNRVNVSIQQEREHNKGLENQRFQIQKKTLNQAEEFAVAATRGNSTPTLSNNARESQQSRSPSSDNLKIDRAAFEAAQSVATTLPSIVSEATQAAAREIASSLAIPKVQQNESIAKKNQETLDDRLGQVSDEALLFFDAPEVDQYYQTDYEKVLDQAVERAIAERNHYNAVCQLSDVGHSKDNLQYCMDVTNRRLKNTEDQLQKKLTATNALFNRAKQIMNEPEYAALESLKQSVTEGYEQLCDRQIASRESKNDIPSEIFSCNGQERLALGFNQISLLSNQAFTISHSINTSNAERYNSPNRIRQFAESCSKINYTRLPDGSIANDEIAIQKICSSMGATHSRNVAVQERREKVERDDQDYHIEYDARLNTVVRKRKKSVGRIVAEGALPSVPNFLGIALSTHQSRASINMLREQGLFQKQYLHTTNMFNNNPWMYGVNYFNTAPLYYNQGLMGSGNPFATGSLNTSSVGISNGFNFGN